MTTATALMIPTLAAVIGLVIWGAWYLTRPFLTDQLAFAPERHQWTGRVLVDEPGISDIDNGRWGRCDIVCARCGEKRRIWRGLALDDPALLAAPCPDLPRPDVPRAPRSTRS